MRQPNLVLITGAGSGIGRATARLFAEGGAHVLVTDIDPDGARATAELISAAGGRATDYRLDVTSDAEWVRLIADIRAAHGIPDVLVNNAGIGLAGGFLEQPESAWDKQLAVNIDGVVTGCRHIAPLMVAARRGHIVNISSGMAFAPVPLTAGYNTSKAAVLMFSQCLRGELAPHGVGVSAVCPGVAATHLIDGELTTDIGVDADTFVRIQRLITAFVIEYGPRLGFGPEVIAGGIVRAVRHNRAVLPVRPESWLAYGFSRLAPGTVRWIAGQIRPDRLIAASRITARLIPERTAHALEHALTSEPPTIAAAAAEFGRALRARTV
ncbi:SDR family NAD(P)-dependent oxidoreductase [Nocardia sp. NPDC056000]|uniref:SDR family NAD(P)-dependent oxidoreductase n=1 Tax=Nocardia sp. NPDC056000 TaxID=3345674 RepID=UPI0035DE7106